MGAFSPCPFSNRYRVCRSPARCGSVRLCFRRRVTAPHCLSCPILFKRSSLLCRLTLAIRGVGAHFALGVVCRLAGCGPVQPNRRGTAKDQVHSDEKAEDHVTLIHRTREKEHCSNQQSETGK